MVARDTICAIATATGGGVGIVRVSGPLAAKIAAGLVRPWPEAPVSHRLHHGFVHHPVTGEPLDEVLACLMRAPRTYTGEDVLELQGHGGAASLARLVTAAVAGGARVAEPGEFTRRAYLAGRIDLSQAEAVATLVAARSERAVRVAQGQLRGGISERIAAERSRLVAILAELEASIDFPEEALDVLPAPARAEGIAAIAGSVGALAETYVHGRLLVEGLDVALVGRPNAGKSSLLNALAGEERALVDATPGTTRDFLEVELDLGGVRVVVVDTAGERDLDGAAGEEVEARGMALGRRRRARADVVVVVVDGQVGVGALEERLVAEAGADSIVVWNKSDLVAAPAALPGGRRPLATAAVTGQGIAALRQALRARTESSGAEDGVVVTSLRQWAALDAAAAALGRAGAALGRGEPPELVAVDLRVALDRLGRVTGESVGSEVLDQVFARFCIGK